MRETESEREPNFALGRPGAKVFNIILMLLLIPCLKGPK